MKILTILFITLGIYSHGQNSKIDSTFNHYFKALEIELNPKKDIMKDREYFDEIDLDTEKVYVSKYASNAIHFLQNISKINAPVKESGIYLPSYVDEKTLQRWKEWYSQNLRNIRWCEKEKRPYLKK